MERGWIKIYRKIQDNPLWNEKPFSRGQAWVDLILLANHKDGYIRKRGVKVDIKKGQLGWSIKGIADRWGWSQGKVKRFLKELKNEEQIEEQNNSLTSLITITNYLNHQSSREQNGEQTESRRRADGEQTETNKNVKKEKNVKNDKNKDIWILPEGIKSDVWQEYEDHRKATKKPLTDAARTKNANILLNNLSDQQEIVDTAIKSGWAGLFPLKKGMMKGDSNGKHTGLNEKDYSEGIGEDGSF